MADALLGCYPALRQRLKLEWQPVLLSAQDRISIGGLCGQDYDCGEHNAGCGEGSSAGQARSDLNEAGYFRKIASDLLCKLVGSN
jgi:hypothetical protein